MRKYDREKWRRERARIIVEDDMIAMMNYNEIKVNMCSLKHQDPPHFLPRSPISGVTVPKISAAPSLPAAFPLILITDVSPLRKQ